MKTILATIALLTSLISFAQIEELGKWKIGMTGSFDNHLSSNFNATPYGNDCGFAPGGCIVEAPTSTFGYSAGILTQYSITRRLEVGIGALYSKQYNTIPEFYPTCGNGCYYLNYIPGATNFIESPVFVRYNFLKTKLNFHIESGVTTTFGLEKMLYDASRFTLKGHSGLGMSYTIGNLINVSATAFYKRKLTDFNRNTDYSAPNYVSFELRTLIVL